MRLRRSEAAELIGISEARLATLEQSDRPLSNIFNWEILAALGNEHLRRKDDAQLPACEWIENWAAESLSEEALASLNRSEMDEAERRRVAHLAECELCRPSLEWDEANPDPIAYLFPAAERLSDKLGRWIPTGVLVGCAILGGAAAEWFQTELLTLGGALLGVGAMAVTGKLRRRGYLP